MQRSLFRKAGLLVFVLAATALVVTGCINEPDPPVKDKVTADIRFVHAVPDAPAVDIWVDGNKVASNVTYKQYSAYITVDAGNRFLRLLPAGESDTSKWVFIRGVSVRSYIKMTMAFFGTSADIQLLQTQERFTYADETSMLVDSCDVKLINLNSGAEVYGFSYKNGVDTVAVINPTLKYSELSTYKRSLAIDNTDLYIMKGDRKTAAITFTSSNLSKPGYRYTFIVVGNSAAVDALKLQDEP